MKSTESGNAGEQAAADYLGKRGFTIVERSYRTPRFEIDIIARKQNASTLSKSNTAATLLKAQT